MLLFAIVGPVNCYGQVDLRDITTGHVIYKHGYCDQPYVVITRGGDWLCVFTTGSGHEGQQGQYIVSTIVSGANGHYSQSIFIDTFDLHEDWKDLEVKTSSTDYYALSSLTAGKLSLTQPLTLHTLITLAITTSLTSCN